MPPLVLLTLLGFGTVIVLALLLWSLLVPPSRPPAPAPPRRRARVSNDEVRGARVAPPQRTRPDGEDAFERFLRAGRDEER